ncbi:hypothetical protein F4677DRAFT_97823 [Hypoxylon crocopeplum]|nr:hypothetical protein F4677DRAFT_97823 [Hypoxylon crocopeplum]
MSQRSHGSIETVGMNDSLLILLLCVQLISMLCYAATYVATAVRAIYAMTTRRALLHLITSGTYAGMHELIRPCKSISSCLGRKLVKGY